MILSQVLHEAIKRGATDIHVQSGTVYWRLGMDVVPTEYQLSDEDMLTFLTDQVSTISDTMMSHDGAMTFEGLRIRVHLFRWR